MPLKLVLCCTLLIATLGQVSKAEVGFDSVELRADFKITHPVKLANLFNLPQKQLLLFGESQDKTRLMAVYQFDSENSQYILHAEAIIPGNFLAFDTLKIGETEKLIFQTNRALMVFSPEKFDFEEFKPVSSIYLRSQAQFLIDKDFIKDVNGDQLEDIVISDFKGLHLFLQTAKGSFEQQTVAISPKVRINEDSATFDETPVFMGDINLDQKQDLVVASQGGLTTYQQNGNGTFISHAHNLQLPVDISPLDWWEVRESDGQQVDQSSLSHRTLNQIKDLNNDQIPDLIVRFSQSEGVFDRQNNYEIYFGRNKDNQLVYSEKPDSVISAEGTIGELKAIDIDGDNRYELFVSSFDIGVSQIIGALLSGSIDQDIYLFKMNDQGLYAEEPSADKEVELSFSLSSGKSGNPVVRLADFDGDGLKDLIVSGGDKKLKVYQGTKEKKLFKSRSTGHSVLVPKDGLYVETNDLNSDGKEDVIVRYGRQDDEKLGNKLVFLLAK